MKSLLMLLLAVLSLCPNIFAEGEECTTAVIGGPAAADGRPILWKNRDTDQLSNKVILVDEKPYRYLAVINAEDTSGRVAWAGLNERGFGIVNSVAYNLPHRAGEAEDLEGIIMATALRVCATVGDFERFLKSNLSPSFGSRANFCVVDGEGGAAIFEVHNHGYSRLDAKDDPSGYLLNTNFSRTGTKDQGLGYVRFDRETELFRRVPKGELTHGFVLQTAARDLGHALEHYPERDEWKNLSADKATWVYANHTINRVSTACAVVIHGVKKGEDPGKATLWIILGEPVTSIAIPLWVNAGQTPALLREGTDAPLYVEATRLKHIARPLPGRDRGEYLDLTRLDNDKGTGWLPGHLRVEQKILENVRRLLAGSASSDDLARTERESAQMVMQELQAVRTRAEH